jgi:spermidine/putrescine-binding protein
VRRWRFWRRRIGLHKLWQRLPEGADISLAQALLQKTGTEIRQESPTDYAKLQSMVENNQVIWDVVNVSNNFGLESTARLLEPLDYSVIDKEPILEGYAGKYWVACMLYANTLAYNTEQIDGTPNNWADLFDIQKFLGQRGFRKSPLETLEVALLGDNVLPESLYPLDVDRALNKLDTARDQIVCGKPVASYSSSSLMVRWRLPRLGMGGYRRRLTRELRSRVSGIRTCRLPTTW